MDEALKARLIGAAVLVAVAVLLIPELLSGRKPTEQAAGEVAGAPGKRIITIDLGGVPGNPAGSGTGGNAPAAAALSPPPALPPVTPEPSTQGSPAAAPADGPAAEPPAAGEQQPTPAASSPAATSVAATPTAGAAAPAPVRATPSPGAAQRPASGGWAVQVGAFGSVATANGMVSKLQAEGYHAFVAPIQRGGKTLHRVRVGPEAEKAGAERLAGQLKAKGLPATVVQND